MSLRPDGGWGRATPRDGEIPSAAADGGCATGTGPGSAPLVCGVLGMDHAGDRVTGTFLGCAAGSRVPASAGPAWLACPEGRADDGFPCPPAPRDAPWRRAIVFTSGARRARPHGLGSMRCHRGLAVRGAAGLREGVRPADVREADQPGAAEGQAADRLVAARLPGVQLTGRQPAPALLLVGPLAARRGQPAGWSTRRRTCSSSRRRLVSRASVTARSPGSWPASKNDRCTVTSLAPPSRPATWSQPA